MTKLLVKLRHKNHFTIGGQSLRISVHPYGNYIYIKKRKNVELRGLGTNLYTLLLRKTNPLIARSFLKVSIVRQLHGKELHLLWAKTFTLTKNIAH